MILHNRCDLTNIVIIVRSLSPEVKKGNRVVDLIQKDFCDVKDKNSSTIASSKSTTTATSLNHVASDNGGKHIEDRICRKTEKTLKTEAAELKYYFETVYILYIYLYDM